MKLKTKFKAALFIGLLSCSISNASTYTGTAVMDMEEDGDPLDTTIRAPIRSTVHPVVEVANRWNCGLDCCPAWYHPCLGPIVTNISSFDLDPYWVDSRTPQF